MDDLPQALIRRWRHSYEESGPARDVYRPADYPFPPARGRGGFELWSDGRAVYHGIGRGDAPTAVAGRWMLRGPSTIHLEFGADQRQPMDLEILAVTDDKLEVERR